MIVYLAEKLKFLLDVEGNDIDSIIAKAYLDQSGKHVSDSEKKSWRNSLGYMARIVNHEDIPDDSGVAIEFQIPRSSNRIDFIITGTDHTDRKSAVIVELKQWSSLGATAKDAIVTTFLNGTHRETFHPSYQAWSYAALLTDFNEAVETENIRLEPCAYLHNCSNADVLRDEAYREHTDRAPAFIQTDAADLRAFIAKHIRHGDRGAVMFDIENGRIRPSKNLSDCLVGMFTGKKEFVLIDDQKLVYETALYLTRQASTSLTKKVLVVHGGPGTGKTVVAINLLVKMISEGLNTQYVSKNSAPREVYEYKLTSLKKKTRISNLFTGSGSFTEATPNIFDALIVDEAHRLNAKSGLYQNKGENQIKELINAAKCAIFFVDEDQRVTLKDIGTPDQIRSWAKQIGVPVEELTLKSQFRCNGSDGYLAWLDHVLGIRETANQTLQGISYDFRVCQSATELRRLIFAANKDANRSRMVAGYCWPWASKTNPKSFDITLPAEGFAARWNLADDGMLWIVGDDSVQEVGCIHTCQGLELDYVGVILGPDFLVRDGVIVTDATKRAREDRSVSGYKKLAKEDPEAAKVRADRIIKNTYRTLMSRGLKGCFLYSVDGETNEYFRNRMIKGGV